MEFSILCKTISLFLFIFHTRADELNVFPEPGTQEDTTSTQGNNLALSATSPTTTALFQGITDADALQQHDQDQSNQDVLLLASENPDCAASSSSIIHSPAGRSKTKRLRFKRSGAKEEGLCEWQEFKDDGSETTTTPPEDYQLRGKRRRPKPGVVNPGIEPVPVGPLMNPGQFFNPELAPYKVDKKPNPQKCPFGQQNIPVCYPKVAPPQIDPALILSPCRTGKCDISLYTL